jgi:hypothetical protein
MDANQLFLTDSDDHTTALQAYAYNESTRHLTGFSGSPLLEDITGLDFWGTGDPNPTQRSQVPEPSVFLLLGSGLCAMVLWRKKAKA